MGILPMPLHGQDARGTSWAERRSALQGAVPEPGKIVFVYHRTRDSGLGVIDKLVVGRLDVPVYQHPVGGGSLAAVAGDGI